MAPTFRGRLLAEHGSAAESRLPCQRLDHIMSEYLLTR
jgi:hypothetical protein